MICDIELSCYILYLFTHCNQFQSNVIVIIIYHYAQHFFLISKLTFEPLHDKTNEMTCAPSKDRSAWASTQSDQSHCCALSGKLRTQAFFMRTAKTDLTGWMHRLIESWLGAHGILLVLTCGGSLDFSREQRMPIVLSDQKTYFLFPGSEECLLK